MRVTVGTGKNRATFTALSGHTGLSEDQQLEVEHNADDLKMFLRKRGTFIGSGKRRNIQHVAA